MPWLARAMPACMLKGVCIMQKELRRWIGVQVLVYLLVHGILYHALWASHSAKMYRDEAFRFEYKWYFSNGAGRLVGGRARHRHHFHPCLPPELLLGVCCRYHCMSMH